MREISGDDSVMTQIVNVADSASAQEAVQRTIDEMGGLHILVNNAGVAPPNMVGKRGVSNNFWDISNEEWDRVVSINSSGPFYMTRAVTPHLLAQGWGRIIGVTTSMNTMYRAGMTPYGPSKAAHEALIAMAARELEGTGVTANVLVPGGMSSTNLIPDDTDYDRASMIQPEIMQRPVVWLASDESDGVTGRRIIGYYWDESLPIEERLEKAGAPAAWPQLGAQSVRPE